MPPVLLHAHHLLLLEPIQNHRQCCMRAVISWDHLLTSDQMACKKLRSKEFISSNIKVTSPWPRETAACKTFRPCGPE
jgi:hypothetical protein